VPKHVTVGRSTGQTADTDVVRIRLAVRAKESASRGPLDFKQLSGKEVGSARRAKKNHAEGEVLNIVGVCRIRTYRTMADMMKGLKKAH
jgi:hypothetical protein